MNLLVDGVLALAGLTILFLAYVHARANARVTRTPGFIVGGPETRIDQDQDRG